MRELRMISHKNRFFYKNNRFSREIHTYSETDFIELYKGFSIWKFETNHRNDGSRLFDVVTNMDRVVATYGGEIDTVEKVKKEIDKLTLNYSLGKDVFTGVYTAILLGGEFGNCYGQGRTEDEAIRGLKIRIYQLRNKN